MIAPARDNEIVLSRSYDAPPERVWAAWTSPKEVDQWWGPDGYVTTTRAMSVEVGGEWLFTMVHPEHGTFPNRVRYRVVEAARRLEYDHDGGEGDPSPFRVTVTFDAEGVGTRLTMRSQFKDAARRQEVEAFGATELGKQTLAHLATHLAR